MGESGKSSGSVVSLRGGPTGLPEVNAAAVEALERWLEMARSGHLVGVALAGLDCDGCGRWALSGRVGGYSMLGALEVVRAELLDEVRDE